MSETNPDNPDDSGIITFKQTIQTDSSPHNSIMHSSPSRGQPNIEHSKSVDTNDLLSSVQVLISSQFDRFNQSVREQLSHNDHKIDERLDYMQMALDKAISDTHRLRDDLGKIQKDNVQNSFGSPPPLIYGPSRILDNRNFSNLGNGDNIQLRNSSPNVRSTNSTSGNSKANVKPKSYDGSEDFGDYLSQFEIIADLNQWDYSTKSLQFASALTGQAVGILGELTPTNRRDFDSLVKALNTRFGCVERSELYRAKLKVLKQEKDQDISQLAQAVKKLTRQAYPNADQNMMEILSLDYFIDALPNSEMRLRIRESRPKNITEAETLAIRLNTYQLAESNQSKTVNAVKGQRSTSNDPILSCLKDIQKSLTDNFGKLQKDLGQIKYRTGQRNGNFQQNNGWRNRDRVNQGQPQTKQTQGETTQTKNSSQEAN